MSFEFKKIEKFTAPLPILIETRHFYDTRGKFFELYKKSEFKFQGINEEFVQFNCSVSNKNVVRGLHYQIAPYAQGKLVMVISGSIMDVFVDIRRRSLTFSQYDSTILTSDKLLYIPPGYAHGFMALEDNTCIMYGCTAEYNKNRERSILWNDPDINIKWPCANARVSEKDNMASYLKDAEVFA